MQIFQTASSIRWKSFKWISCFIILAFIISIAILIVTLQQVYTPSLPRLNTHLEQAKKILLSNQNANYPGKKMAAACPGFRKYITNKETRLATVTPFTKPYPSLTPETVVQRFNRFP